MFLRQLAGFASLASVAPAVIGCGDDGESDSTDGAGTGATTNVDPDSGGSEGSEGGETTGGAAESSGSGGAGTTTGEDGSTSGAEGTTSGSDEGAVACPNEVVASIVSDPEHSLVIPPEDIAAGVEVAYDIQGIAGHPHRRGHGRALRAAARGRDGDVDLEHGRQPRS